MKYADSTKPISLRALRAGQKHFDWRDGAAPAGPEAAPVSPSPPPANAKAKKTTGISGQRSTSSSPSAGLQRSLESRLRARMDVSGSPEYVLIWKPWAMKSGPPICALRGRARRTSDSDFTGWPTPQAHDSVGGKTPEQVAAMRAEGHGVSNLNEVSMLAGWPTTRSTDATNGVRSPKGAIAEFERKGTGADLPTVATLAGWPTPTTCEAPNMSTNRGNGQHRPRITPQTVTALMGWTTPSATDGERGGTITEEMTGSSLAQQAALTGWATPTTLDHKDNAAEGTAPTNALLGRQAWLVPPDSGPASPSPTARTERHAALNPSHSRWLMGFHQRTSTPGWDSCAPGFSSWATIQKLLHEFSARPSETESADSVASATQSCPS